MYLMNTKQRKKAEKALLRSTSNQLEKRDCKELPILTFSDYFPSSLILEHMKYIKNFESQKTFDHIIQYSKHCLILRFKYLTDHAK